MNSTLHRSSLTSSASRRLLALASGALVAVALLGDASAKKAAPAPAPAPVAAPPAPTTKITWHGHAAFEIVTPKGKVLMIDPWLKNPMNPDAKDGKDPVAGVTKLDYILLTHGHSDHVGDSVALAKKTGARLVTNIELGNALAHTQGYPPSQMGFDTLLNIGGEITIADGEVTVKMVPAVHSSGLDGATLDAPAIYGGNPGGFILFIKNGPTIYHSGDTAFFGDMALIGEHEPDLGLINIGGHFGMEPPMAARAASVVKAKLVVPMHFKTFPVITQSTAGFFAALDAGKVAHKELAPGESLVYEGKTLKAGK